jgi:hypothetical protein
MPSPAVAGATAPLAMAPVSSGVATGWGGWSGAPQFSQKAVPGKFSCPQVGHVTLASLDPLATGTL